MASSSVNESSYYHELVAVHELRFNNIVRLLKANREYENAIIQLSDAELGELLNPEGDKENLDPVDIIKKRRQDAEYELIRIDVLQEKLFSNPWSSSMITFIGANLKRGV